LNNIKIQNVDGFRTVWIKIIWSIITLTKLKMSFTTFYTYIVAFFS